MGIDYTKRPAASRRHRAPATAPPRARRRRGGVSLSKVTLTKAAPTVSLTKHGGASAA